MLKDPGAKGKDFAYTVVRRGDNLGQAIRTQRWRYARWPDGEELYDLHNDPAEHRNLAGSPEQIATLNRMRRLLEQADMHALNPR